MKQNRQRRKHRVLPFFLCFCMLFSMPGIQNVFPVVAAAEQEESFQRENIITEFDPLSEDVKVQTVFTGTDLDELDLPKELTVSLLKDSSEQEMGESEQENTRETDSIEKNYDTETEGEQDIQFEENEVSEETTVAPNEEMDAEDEDKEGERASFEVQEESVSVLSAEELEESKVAQETHTVTMQVYHAENVISVQTLESTQTEKQEETVTIDGVTWQSEPEYDGSAEGTYTFTAVLPDGYTLAEGVSLPEITVTVIESESGTDFVIQALLDRIAALLDVEEYLATEPDMDDEDAYAEWEEKLYEYAEEALAIWEEYEALTEEQQAMIAEEELAKLTAWVELAETFSDHTVMLADDSEHHGESDWTALTASDTTLSGGKYYLSSDITMNTITVTGNVTLCLNGHTLTHDDSTDGSVIVVESGTFTLCDCQDNYTYSWNDSKENPVYTLGGSGGCITGGNGYNSQGGGVHVKANATFVMNSGRITECNVGTDAGHNGGGVYVAAGAIFEMTGGFIENNAAASGGGVCVEGCFIMSDEAVIMNNASGSGGGVGITSGSGSFTMRGGKIIGNTASALGGGVQGNLNATINMEGGLIEGNSASNGGGGLNIPSNSPTKLSGGTIRYNRMSGSVGLIDAGGVRLLARTSTLELSGSISIYDNYYSDGTISNVFLPNNASVTITGPLTNFVGITSQTKPPIGSGDNGVVVANENTSEDYDYHCIVSDENYRVIKSGSQILLAEWTGNPVTITAYKDGLEWVENPPTYKLTSDNGTSFVTDLTAVPDGEYHVYEGDTDTGVTVKVDGAAATAEVYYHTVTFYDGSTVLTTPAQQIVLKNQTASAPATDPAKTGYTFGKWVTADGGSTAYDFTKAVTGKTSVYASWTPVSYSITYILDGGTAAGNPASYTIESGAITLKNPTRTGYSFTGWGGTDLTGNNNTSVTIAAGSTGDRTYTAYWKAADYAVTLHTNGGTGGTDLTSYTYGTGAALPTDWTKTGYTFDGWYDNERFTGTAVTDISATDTGNKEYWAKWTANTYQVTFDYHGADGGNTTQSKTVTYDSTYGALPVPARTGYTFKGWYTEENGQGSKVDAGTTVTTTSAHTLHACWKDETAPGQPVLQDGVTLPAGWTNAQDTIPLKLYDGVGVVKLLVSVDGNPYAEVSGFSGGTGSVNYNYAVLDGEHTYQFKAVDAADNVSEESAVFTVKLDQTKPVIGTITYENKAANLWQWIIGKTSMVVHVPVTDTGSGVTKISYTLTPRDAAGNPDSSNAVEKTATVKDGEAKLTFDVDFRGTITINCTDAAGNKADGVIIGKDAGGVIVEDHAPDITTDARTDYYDTPTAVNVTVKDDTNNAVTAGIAAITYKVGDDAEKSVTVVTSALQAQVTFTIPASEIPTGTTEIKITAKDHAGNEAVKSITIKVKGPEKQPAAEIDYREEELTGLVPNGVYSIDGTEYTADQQGHIPIIEGWFGNTVSIIKKGNGNETTDSPAQSLPIPARPAAPDAPELSVRDDKSITLKPITGAQYRLADGTGNWQDSTAFTGLAQKTIYKFKAYYPATDTSFASPESGEAQIATMPTAPTPDKLKIGYVAETLTLTDGIEAFTDQNCQTPVNGNDVAVYMGQTLYIRYPVNGIIPASLTTAVSIPARPAKPVPGQADASYPGAKDGAITGLTSGTAYEYRVKDQNGNFGAWQDASLNGTRIENLPAGEYEVRVKAVETGNVSFRSEAAAVTIGEKPATKYETPNIRIDYSAEALTGFAPGAEYTINGKTVTAGADGTINIETDWFGATLSIVRKGNGKDKLDSDAQSLPVPARPAKPTPTGVDVSTAGGTGKLTGLTADTTYEVSTDGGKTWVSHTADGNGEITGLAPGTYVVRVKAGTSNFASEPSDSVKIGAFQIKVTFMVDGAKYKEISVDYGTALTDIPPVPAKENAIGAWCMDEQGITPAEFTNITADMTVYAVYTTTYTVTLQGGTGYTLSAEAGSTSPVKEGGSFTFRFALARGYQKTASFAVKVNDVKVELAADGTYIISDVRENKTVTVEGVAKKPGGKPSNSGGGDKEDEPEPESTPTPIESPVDTPQPAAPPQPTPQPPSPTNPPEQSQPTDTPDSQPEDKQEPESIGTPDPTEEPSETEKEQQPEGDGEQTVPASIDDGKIIISGEPVATGNVEGMTDTSTVLALGNGAVIVTVVCTEQEYTAGVADTIAVANAVLTPEQMALVNNGETIEIRIDVKDISDQVPEQDKKVIENGIEEYRKEVPGLVLGMYVDISMFIKIGAGEWNAITTTKEPIEVIIGIPEKLQEKGRAYYIIRAHDGVPAFMNDMDDEPSTITVSTDLFSSYAIAYVQAAGTGHKCSLCHICPTFLGICYFIWLAIIIALILISWIVIRRNSRKQDGQES